MSSQIQAPNNIFKSAIRKVVQEELVPVEFKLDSTIQKLEDLESEINDFMSKSDERHDLVMRTLDKIVGMFKNHDEEHTMLGAGHKSDSSKLRALRGFSETCL